LEPAKNYSIVRYTLEDRVSKFVAIQIDIEYEPHDEIKWVPSQWSVTKATKSGPTLFSQCVVKKLEINPAMDPSQFELAFPSGTMISDLRGGTEKTYIQTDDQHTREIPRGEL
jgi:hypothetical protein